MRILIVNDDGIDAKGLNTLARVLCKKHEVCVIAPMEEKSGASHALTFHGALNYYELQNNGYAGYVVNGTPCDCVKFGAEIILNDPPDVVLSGINNVANLGTDAIYSGTVNAAIEGSMLGFKSIAVSLDCRDGNYDYACRFIDDNLSKLLNLLPDSNTVWNINIPFGYSGQSDKISFAKSGKRVFADEYQYVDDKGWLITGHPVNVENDGDTDVKLHERGYVTLTPVKVDFNDYALYEKLRGKKL